MGGNIGRSARRDDLEFLISLLIKANVSLAGNVSTPARPHKFFEDGGIIAVGQRFHTVSLFAGEPSNLGVLLAKHLGFTSAPFRHYKKVVNRVPI